MLSLIPVLSALIVPTATAYESETQDIIISQETQLLEDTLYETGFFPSGSAIAVGFSIEANQTAWVDMLAEGELTWPEALSLGWHGVEDNGWLSLLTELELTTAVQYDISGYTGEYEIDTRSFTSEAETNFDPLLLPNSAQSSVSLNYSEELDDWSTSFSPISVIDIIVSVTASLSSSTNLSGVRIETEGADNIVSDGTTTQLDVPNDIAIDVRSAWVGLWDTDVNLTLTPALEICVDLVLYSTCETVAETDYEAELSGSQFEESFDPVDYMFPLPWLDTSHDSYDFGEQTIETTQNLALEVANPGLMPLIGNAVLEGDAAFEVWPDSVYAPSESLDGLVVSFTPPAPGEYSAILTLETNDPREPSTEIALTGTGAAEEQEDDLLDDPNNEDTGSEKLESIDGEVTCGCAAGPVGLAMLPLALVALVLPARRRENISA